MLTPRCWVIPSGHMGSGPVSWAQISAWRGKQPPEPPTALTGILVVNSRVYIMKTFNSTKAVFQFLRKLSLTASNLLLTHHSKKLPGVLHLEVGREQSQARALIYMTEEHLSWLTQRNKRLGGHTGLGDANGIDRKDADLIGHTFNHLLGLKSCFFAEIKI